MWTDPEGICWDISGNNPGSHHQLKERIAYHQDKKLWKKQP